MRTSRPILICGIMLGLSGCLRATPPEVPLPTPAAIAEPAAIGFDDALMQELLGQLQGQNLNLKIAEQRLAEAEAQVTARHSDVLPRLDLTAGASRGNQNNREAATLGQAGFQANWDLDLAGRTRNSITAAESRRDASAARLADLKRLLRADLLTAIVQWRAALEIQHETTALLQSQDDQVALFQSRSDAGLIDATLLERARAQRDQTATQLPLAEINRRTAQFQIEHLLGQTPNSLDDLLTRHRTDRLQVPPANSVITLPMTTVTTRPDVAAARANLLASQADLAAAEAAWWPSLSLSSFFGVQDGSISLPGNPPGHLLWSLASALTTPLVNFGQIDANIDAANARSQQANLIYQDTILQALQEIHTALAGYLNGLNAINRQTEARTRRAETVRLATERFDRGLTDMTVLTTAQAELDQATIALITQKAETAIAYIRLQQALGGTI